MTLLHPQGSNESCAPQEQHNQLERSNAQPSYVHAPAIPTPTPEGVQQFKTLYLKRFGVELDEEQALDLATRYLHIFSFGVTRPLDITERPVK